jgi:hypothetical protein
MAPNSGFIGIAAAGVTTFGIQGVFGDINFDGVLDLADHAAWTSSLGGPGIRTAPAGASPQQFVRADLDGDGDVDLADYALMQEAWAATME